MCDTTDRGNTPDRGTPLRPIVFLDLNSACSDLALLIFTASEWVPREQSNALADELRNHLRAAAELLRRNILKYRASIEQQSGRLDEAVYISLAGLHEELKGRRAGVSGRCEISFPLDVDDLCSRPFEGKEE
jgi:hypothetical protein